MFTTLLEAYLTVLIGGIAFLIMAGCAPLFGVSDDPLPDAPRVEREFRGMWITSVANLDWPSEPGLSTDQQQQELVALLDRAVELNLNAVILQVRSAGDAMYDSPYEPWSEFLTGEMGRAPDPYYDPLEFAVEKAHERGLELHAWFNPFRLRYGPDDEAVSSNHLSRSHPHLAINLDPVHWLNPGEPEAQEHVHNVIMDVVQRYDVDGIHFDDYFYPYPLYDSNNRIRAFPDDDSWERAQNDGFDGSRSDWRRDNINRFVESIYRGIRSEDQHILFGISPFGIWRPGYPATVTGLDAYNTLYADARHWLQEGWLDYLAPQLYWQIEKQGQEYPILLDWWSEQNTRGRHLWPGNFTSRASPEGGEQWPVEEIVQQVRLTQQRAGATGNIHFRSQAFMTNSGGINEQLLDNVYQNAALPPPSPWLDDRQPATPLLILDEAERQLQVEHGGDVTARRWIVQRRHGRDWSTRLEPGTASAISLAGAEGRPADEVHVYAVSGSNMKSEVAIWPEAEEE